MDDKKDKKLVPVHGVGVVSFPSVMSDEQVRSVIQQFRQKSKPITTEQSEHQRQLKPAQPLDTAIPDWLKQPIPETAERIDKAFNRAIGFPGGINPAEQEIKDRQERANKAFDEAFPKTSGAMLGAHDFAEGLMTPASIALLLTAPQSKLLSAFFASQALKGSYASAKEAENAFHQGKNQDAAKYATESILGLGTALLAGRHAVHGTAVDVSAFHPDTKTINATAKTEIIPPKPNEGYGEYVQRRLGSGQRVIPHEELAGMLRDFQTYNNLKYQAADKPIEGNDVFHLKSTRAIDLLGKNPRSKESVRNFLIKQGVGKDELAATGLYNEKESTGLLAGTGMVTPEELRQHQEENSITMKEVMLGDPGQPEPKFARANLVTQGTTNPRELLITMPSVVKDPVYNFLYRRFQKATEKVSQYTRQYSQGGQIVPVGEAQRLNEELAKTKAALDVYVTKVRPNDKPYTGGHYGETPNTVMHARIGDYVGHDGKMYLVVDEGQSDLASALMHGGERPGVPDFPFKSSSSWAPLLMRRLFRYAADHGYEGIAWTPGQVQADRYNLQHQIDEIRYAPATGPAGKYDIEIHKGGKKITNKTLTPQELETFVGKEIAKKIVNGEGTPDDTSGQGSYRRLSGLDLEVGGKFHQQLYDKIIPDTFAKLGKQHGVTPQKMEFSGEVRFTKQERADLDHWISLMREREAARDVYYELAQKSSKSIPPNPDDHFAREREAHKAWLDAGQRETDFIKTRMDLRDKWLKSTDHEAKKTKPVEMSYLPLPEDVRGVVRQTSQSLFNKVYVAPKATDADVENANKALLDAKRAIRADAPKPPDGEPTPEWIAKAEAWMKENEPRIKDYENLNRQAYRLRNMNAGQVRKLSDGRKVTYLTREGLRTLSNAESGTYEENYGLYGQTISKAGVDAVVNGLRDSQSPIKDIVSHLIEQGKNDDGSVTINFIPSKDDKISNVLSVLREELSHAWQHGISSGVLESLPKEDWFRLYDLIPAPMRAYLERNGYDTHHIVEHVTEASAKLMGFPPSEFGMTPAQAANYLYEYLSAIVKQHGAKALDALTHINKLGRQIKEYFTNGSKEPDGPADQGDTGGISTGRQGGPAEAYASTGGGSGPTASERQRLDSLKNNEIQPRSQYNERANKEVRDYLRANGFNISGQNADPTKTVVYTRYSQFGKTADAEKSFNGDVSHTVIVYPNGEWEHTSESAHSGSGPASLSALQIEADPGKRSDWPGVKMSFNRMGPEGRAKLDALRFATMNLRRVIQ